MIAFHNLLMPPYFLVYALNVSLASVVVCAIALLLNCRRTWPLVVRHALLVVALGACIAAPMVVALLEYWSIGGIRVAEYSSHTQRENATVDLERNLVRSNPGPVHAPPASGTLSSERNDGTRTAPEMVAEAQQTAETPMKVLTTSWGRERSEWTVLRAIGTGLASVWLIGSGIVFARTLVDFVRLARWSKGWSATDRPLVAKAVRMAADRTGLRSVPPVVCSGTVLAPMVCGLFRPTIVVPPEMESRLSLEQINSVLLHEMAHIVRHDTWIGMLQRLSLALYWWNPLVYITNRKVSMIREHICDDIARHDISGSRDYAAALISMAERASGTVVPASSALHLSSLSELELRVRRILSTPPSTDLRLTRIAGVAILAATALMSGGILFA